MFLTFRYVVISLRALWNTVLVLQCAQVPCMPIEEWLAPCRRYAPVPLTFTNAVLATYIPIMGTAAGVRAFLPTAPKSQDCRLCTKPYGPHLRSDSSMTRKECSYSKCLVVSKILTARCVRLYPPVSWIRSGRLVCKGLLVLCSTCLAWSYK